MANTKNAKKAQRQAAKRRLDNRLHAKTTRNLIKKTAAGDKDAPAITEVIAKIDKLAKKNVIHKNKAANLKSKLMKKVAASKA
jgi:small subunit ribosomal protein S20